MKSKLFLIFILAFFLRFIVSFIVWHPDVNNHIDWGIRFFEYGTKNFYAPHANIWSYTWPNQPPGTIYIFAGIKMLFDFIFNIFWTINIKVPVFPSIVITYFESNLYPALLKLPSLMSDIGIGYVIYKITKKLSDSKKAKFAAILWLINPIIWYNSTVWGQTDAIINFLALLAFYLLFERKLFWSVLVLVVSFYIKVSLVIFLPMYLIVLFKQKFPLSKAIFSGILSGFIILLVTLPFVYKGDPLTWLIALYQTKILGQQLHVITANAFNIWATLTGIHEQPNSLLLGPLSYDIWGNMFFLSAYVPILYMVWKKSDLKTTIWSLALVSFSSWMFLTNMHERYLYPLFPYLTILVGINSISLFIYWIVSLINLLNLYNFWWIPRIEPIVNFMSFGDRLMPRVLGFMNFILFGMMYKKGLQSKEKGVT